MRSFQTDILILFRLVKNINLPKIYNLLQLSFSYIISGIRKEPYIIGLPWSISVEPTNACNLSCPECPTGTKGLSRLNGNMNQDLFESIIKEAGKNAFFMNLYFQGEPFLNTNLINMIIIAKQNRFFTSCATNAQFINDALAKKVISSGLDHLVIAFDGTTQESYEKYRIGGSFDLLNKAINMLVEEKQKQKQKYPIIVLQFLILKHNENQIYEAKELAKLLGVDKLVFKTAQLNVLNQENPFLPENPKHSRYNIMPDGTLKMKHLGKNRCWKSWSSCVITWDGRVVPCCFDKDASYCYGTLDDNSFKEIIFGERSREFKKRILINRKGINICSNCSET